MLLHSYPNSYTVRVTSVQCVLWCLTPVLEQFSKYANMFFLFTVCIQQIPGVSPTNQYTTIAPLAVVLLASAIKEFQEDLVRETLHRKPSRVTDLLDVETASIRL